MLGSAIPRRWIFSLALVGLVTIFAVSYAAVWSSPANADSQGTGTAGGNNVDLDPNEILDHIDQLPTGLTMLDGEQLTVTLNTFDLTGAPNATFPTVTYDWTIVSGSGVSFIGATDERTVVIQASSPGTTTIEAFVEQRQKTRSFAFFREMTISVVSPNATSTPLPPATNPGTPPSSIPNSQGVVTPAGTILVSTTGVETGSSAEDVALNNRPAVFIRSGSVSNFFGINVSAVQLSSLPPLPARFRPGSSAVDISFTDASGVRQDNFRLKRSARICLPTSPGDLSRGFSSVKVLRYNDAVGQWVRLTSTYNTRTRQVCANSSNFSNFAVGVLRTPPTPGPEGNLPATGGWSPGAGLMLFAGLLGFALVGGGAVSMRRARNARSE